MAREHWSASRQSLVAWWEYPKNPRPRQEVISYGLDDYMAAAVLGGVFADGPSGQEPFRAGIKMYELWLGEPKYHRKRRFKPRELAYWLCRHYLYGELDRGDLLAAGRHMLGVNLQTHWLKYGQSLTAAIWLMLVYWYPAFHYQEELPDPVDVLLRAYDDMPKVKRPF